MTPSESDNGTHPAADANHFIFLQPRGAAGDAVRWAVSL